MGEAQTEVACRQGREEGARQRAVRDHNWQSQGLRLQARLCACHPDRHQILDNGAEADDRERAQGRVQGPGRGQVLQVLDRQVGGEGVSKLSMRHCIALLTDRSDPEIRDLVITEFYSHVKRMINHPEAAWIVDDIYRAVATPEQKNRLLREWYGPEFSIKGLSAEGTDSAELSAILKESPEKRKPIMGYLENQINSLIQKKLTGFTMLHDAMLQYFLVCEPGTEQANDFLEHLKPDPTTKEGEEADNVDLMKNLAFTKSGSRLVSLCFAYGTAKDRKLFLRPYKDTVETMAYDQNAHHVLLAAMAVTDDTKLSAKSIFSELLPSNDALPEKVLNLVNDARARTVLLYPLAADAKWLLDDNTRERLNELYAIRQTTSKKDPNIRLQACSSWARFSSEPQRWNRRSAKRH
jgi:pumilio family protein 6